MDCTPLAVGLAAGKRAVSQGAFYNVHFTISQQVFDAWNKLRVELHLDDAQIAALLLQSYENQGLPPECSACFSPLTQFCPNCHGRKPELKQAPLSVKTAPLVKIEIVQPPKDSDTPAPLFDDSDNDAGGLDEDLQFSLDVKFAAPSQPPLKIGRQSLASKRPIRLGKGRPKNYAELNEGWDDETAAKPGSHKLGSQVGFPRVCLVRSDSKTKASSSALSSKATPLPKSTKGRIGFGPGNPGKIIESHELTPISKLAKRKTYCVTGEKTEAQPASDPATLPLRDSVGRLRKVRGGNPGQCKMCGLKFKYQGSLETHLKQKHTEADILPADFTFSFEPARCNICSKDFKQVGPLVNHMRKHKVILSSIVNGTVAGDPSLICILCGQQFTYRTSLKNHKIKAHQKVIGDDNIDDLDPALLLYGDGKDDQQNQEEATGENQGEENQDDELASTSQQSDSQQESDNTMGISEHFFQVSKSGIILKHVCGVCGKRFAHLASMARHAARHDKRAGNPFLCNECNQTFLTMPEFTAHLCGVAGLDLSQQHNVEPFILPSQAIFPRNEQGATFPVPDLHAFGNSELQGDRKVLLSETDGSVQIQAEFLQSAVHSHLPGFAVELPHAVSDPANNAQSSELGNANADSLATTQASASSANAVATTQASASSADAEAWQASASEQNPFAQPLEKVKKKRGPKPKPRDPALELKDAERPFQCPECPLSYRYESGLQIHMQKHTGVGAFPCPQCDRSFGSLLSRQKHQTKDHWGSGPITCHVCGKQFAKQKALDCHLPTHMEKATFKCHECNRIFRTPNLLIYHKRQVHRTHMNYKCGYCGRMFVTKTNYENHVSSHNDEKNHLCTRCGEAFVSEHRLKRHMKKHNPKQWVCDECGKRFSVKSDYNRHKTIHLKVRPYPCSDCNLRFLKPHLREQHHQRVHQHLRPHKCETCGASYFTGYRLREHIRSQHTNERPFKCPLCPKSFAKSDTRKQHMRVSHRVNGLTKLQELVKEHGGGGLEGLDALSDFGSEASSFYSS